MSVTAAQVIAALQFKAAFTINQYTPASNTLTMSDVTNWALLGITDPPDTANCILKILDPTDIPIYENTGWDTDDFTSPDTTLAAASKGPINLPLTSNDLAVAGTYQVFAKFKVIDDPDAPVFGSKLFSFDLCSGVVALKLCIELTFDCDTAQAIEKDLTNYSCSDYPTVNITRLLTITPPLSTGQAPTTSTGSTCTAPDLFSPVTYQASLEAEVDYSSDDNLTTVNASYKKSIEEKSNCDDSLCAMFCCLKKLEEAFHRCRKNNSAQQVELNAWIMGSLYYQLAKDARRCGHEALIPTYVERFYKATNCDPKCNCCGEHPAPVIPKGDCNCTDGTNGKSVEMNGAVTEDGNYIVQYRLIGDVAWITILTIPLAAITASITAEVTAAVTTAISASVTEQINNERLRISVLPATIKFTNMGGAWQDIVSLNLAGSNVLSAVGDEARAEFELAAQDDTVQSSRGRVHIGPHTIGAVPLNSIEYSFNGGAASPGGGMKTKLIAKIIRMAFDRIYIELSAITGEDLHEIDPVTGIGCGPASITTTAVASMEGDFDWSNAANLFINVQVKYPTGDDDSFICPNCDIYNYKIKS